MSITRQSKSSPFAVVTTRRVGVDGELVCADRALRRGRLAVDEVLLATPRFDVLEPFLRMPFWVVVALRLVLGFVVEAFRAMTPVLYLC